MIKNKYKNIELTDNIKEAKFITHSGKFHVDDTISTIFLSKIFDKVVLIRIPSIDNKNITDKIVYDIGGGEFDHHQKNRNGQRDNGIYYSSIGLLWRKYGKEYLKTLMANNIEKTFKYIDEELIQYIDAADNMQTEYVKNKILPDFIKLCNPEWNEKTEENEAFIKALKLADEFWEVYIKHAIAVVEATEIILKKIEVCKDCYLILDTDMPYKRAISIAKRNDIKYIIFKSKREGYDIRTLIDSCRFKDEISKAEDIEEARKASGIKELIYIDVHGKLCCTETLESAIQIVKYNEKVIKNAKKGFLCRVFLYKRGEKL